MWQEGLQTMFYCERLPLTDLICFAVPLMTQTLLLHLLLHLHSSPLLSLLKAEVQEGRSISQISEVTVTKATVAQSAGLRVRWRWRGWWWGAQLICRHILSTLCLLAGRDIYSPDGAAVITRPTWDFSQCPRACRVTSITDKSRKKKIA